MTSLALTEPYVPEDPGRTEYHEADDCGREGWVLRCDDCHGVVDEHDCCTCWTPEQESRVIEGDQWGPAEGEEMAWKEDLWL